MTDLKSISELTRRARWLWPAWALFTLAAAVISILTGEATRRAMFDRWQEMSPRDLSNTQIEVVLIDSESLATVGPWPWPRYYMARLTEEIAARGASVIAFDILFSEPDRVRPDLFVKLYPELSARAAAEVGTLEPMDQLFGRVIGASPVVLARAGSETGSAGAVALPSDIKFTGTLPTAIANWPTSINAIPELDDVALGHGLVNARPDSDGVIRSVPLVMRVGGQSMPGLALEIARVKLEASEVRGEPVALSIAKRRIPVDDQARMQLHFGSFPASNIVSAAELLKTGFPKDAFAGKIVLVGLSAEGTSDIVATPTASEEFGVLVQAQAVDTLLRGGWLERPIWAMLSEWGVALALALLALAAALTGKLLRIGVVIAFLGIAFICWIGFDNLSLLLDPVRPLLVGSGAVTGLVIGSFMDTRRERERLREVLVQERIVAAQAEGELQAARAIQLSMVPPRERLAAMDRRIDCDALLEPARSVGGDFFDLIRIDENVIGFVIADVTGKGVPAALFMAMSKALTSAALSKGSADLEDVAATINAELLRDNSEAMSVTMLIGLIDLRTGAASVVCAGHEDPMLLARDGLAVRIKLEGGPPFCVADFPYLVEQVELRQGDTLVLVTDGVTEAQDANGALYGRDRVLTDTALADATATEICESIRADVRRFENGTEATDDLAVLAIRFLGN